MLAILVALLINYVSVDRSAKALADSLSWQGKNWKSTRNNFPVPRWDETFLATDGDMGNIYGFGHDPDFTYVMRDSLLDNYLYVREGYKLKTSGTLTAIAIREEVFPVTAERTRIRLILSESLSKHYRCQFDDFRYMSSVRLSYNKSLVADFLFGWITYDGNFWYFIPKADDSGYKSRHEKDSKSVDCYQIDKQYSELFMGFKSLYYLYSNLGEHESVSASPVGM